MQKIADLTAWALKNGVTIDENVDFISGDTSGAFAQVKGDILGPNIINVPRSLTITPEYGQTVFSELNDDDDNVNGKLQLLLAKLKFDKCETITGDLNLSSKFKSYIDFLPCNGVETKSPYFWTMQEKDLLDGTDAHIFMKRRFLQSLKEWKKFASKLYELDPKSYPQLKDELLEYEAFKMGPVGGVAVNYLLNIKPISWTSFTAYLWSSAIFTSRAFPYILFDQSANKNSAFLLPIVDLLNHENGAKVRWTIENDCFVFNSLVPLTPGMKLNNNYGDKSNLELLLGYGFVVNHNEYETATLTLQVDESVVNGAVNYGIELPSDSTSNGINFVLSKKEPLPESILKFFGYLSKLSSEKKGTSVRMRLEGLSQLRAIIQTKLNSLKKLEVIAGPEISQERAAVIKQYRNTQKGIFQQSIEQADKVEKSLLKTYKPFSFKTVMKHDTRFFNGLFLTFGLRAYEDIVENNMLDHYILLWIMRIANKDKVSKEDQVNFPQFIYDTFMDVKKTTKVDDDDVTEYLPLYESLFPSLCQKIPEVFGDGEWTLNNLIFAGTVSDRLVYKRLVNNEVFFVERKLI